MVYVSSSNSQHTAPHRDIASDQPDCRRLGSKFLWLRCNDPIFYCQARQNGQRLLSVLSSRVKNLLESSPEIIDHRICRASSALQQGGSVEAHAVLGSPVRNAIWIQPPPPVGFHACRLARAQPERGQTTFQSRRRRQQKRQHRAEAQP